LARVDGLNTPPKPLLVASNNLTRASSLLMDWSRALTPVTSRCLTHDTNRGCSSSCFTSVSPSPGPTVKELMIDACCCLIEEATGYSQPDRQILLNGVRFVQYLDRCCQVFPTYIKRRLGLRTYLLVRAVMRGQTSADVPVSRHVVEHVHAAKLHCMQHKRSKDHKSGRKSSVLTIALVE